MQHQPGIEFVGILVEVVDPGRVEAAGPAFDAMHRVALLEEQLGKVAAVLPRNAGDQGCFERRHGQGNAMNQWDQIIGARVSRWLGDSAHASLDPR